MIKLIVFILLTASCYGKKMNKIFGGKIVNIREFPHQVSLEYNGYHICGGSILTNYHIITAASCVLLDLNIVPGNLRVLAGTNDRRNAHKSGTYHNVEYVIYHPDYSPQLFWKHNIAILKLEEPMIIDRRVRKKIRISKNPLHPLKLVKICGWGYNAVRLRRLTRYLKTTQLKITSREYCLNYYNNYGQLYDSQRCALTVDPNAAIIWGNGGAGVVLLKQLAGIISVSLINNAKTIILTKLYPLYHEWIENVVLSY